MSALAVKDTSNQGFVLSVVLHVGIIAAAWVGMPFLKTNIPTEETPIIVDLVEMSDVTSAPPPPSKEEAPVAPVAPPEPPAPVQAQAPPADAMPPPPKEEVPVKEPEKAPQPKVRPTSKPTPPPDKKRDVAVLQDLVKDLAKKAPAPTPQAKSTATEPSNNIAPNITDRASMTEQDAIRRHIEGCWRIDPGTEGMENMSAEVQVLINPDGSVRDAKILDMGRYFADAAFRRFATSARTAILGCGNIPISAERYNIFKDIKFNFSPQGRLN